MGTCFSDFDLAGTASTPLTSAELSVSVEWIAATSAESYEAVMVPINLRMLVPR